MSWSGRELRSTIDEHGTLALSLEHVELTEPGDDEVIVRIEATPINPSDIGLLLGPADLSRIESTGSAAAPRSTLAVPPERLTGVAGRISQSLPVGNEGAGTVVAAGKNAAALQGKRVGMYGGGMYADYRKIGVDNVNVLPEGAGAADGASMFINPLTALGFIETARSEGHKAIVHTPAASNLGQMLQRICLADGVPLVNIVRSEEQAAMLRGIGATYVLNSKDEDFSARLTDAIAETGATIAFDAIGGGALGSDILRAMERAAARTPGAYSRYGSTVFKHLYIYGSLDTGPTVLNRGGFGYAWSVSAWLLFNYLGKAGPEVARRLRRRVTDELTTTFASHYTRTIGLAEVLQPDVLRAIDRKATGEKFLIDPSLG
ncbi:zinc-binding dehydrogenase [Burkholderia sp. FERM BP-3421]|uniref:zinc-binding dehydrogenase n=1 Tax=Burkholderia sp. FERM BP-3421 TaxID=1494466 RepID=UPI00235E94B2|nr:zinc-binding dehydrogenase [Burkholderia sp. FERM BP-3421]WDD90914.1 zinc-binding dehydrogenase [Burkholderia sp. FERM BP-3421]